MPEQIEDSKENIAFCLQELEEAKHRGLTIDELIRELTFRSCRQMEETFSGSVNYI